MEIMDIIIIVVVDTDDMIIMDIKSIIMIIGNLTSPT